MLKINISCIIVLLYNIWLVSCDCPAPSPCTCQSNIIYCDHLNLTEIPHFSQPADPKSVWDIELHNNKLKIIPNNAFRHLKLEMLLLFENEIEVVEDEALAGSEDTLYVLHLYSNKLSSLPSAVGKMKNLMGLDIHDNPMPTIREDIIKNISSTLSSIMFGNPEMKSWPSCLQHLQNLTSIRIEDLNICKIPDDALDSYTILSSYEMISTRVTYIPSSLSTCSNIESINLVNNTMLSAEGLRPQVFAKLHNVMNINIMNSSIKTLPNIFSKMSKLYILQLENNPISSISDDVFPLNFSTNFWFLTLKNTSLTSVPKALSNLTSLTRLDFVTSFIKEIQDEDFRNMRKLQRLYFSNNQLHVVSDKAFVGLDSLTFLTLDNTYLTTIPKAVVNLPVLTDLSLSNNRIVCSCDNFNWIKSWKRHKKVEIYGSCSNIRMTLALYIYKELPKC